MSDSRYSPSGPLFVPAANAATYTDPSQRTPDRPRRNPLGVASLVIGLIALAGAFIPVVNLATGYVAVVAIVLGVLALFLQGYGKLGAVAGVLVGVGALVLSIVLAGVYSAGSTPAASSPTASSAPTSTASPASPTSPSSPPGDADEPAPDVAPDATGTRDDPYPIGETIAVTDAGEPVWDVELGTPTLDADAVIAATNQFNDAPPAGFQYALVPVTATYTGTDVGTPWLELTVVYIAANGTEHTTADLVAAGPDPLIEAGQLAPGETGSGNEVVLVPTDGLDRGLWRLSIGFFDGDEIFFALQ
jgi:hypothetical protein